jgi:hypothetical protein
MERAMRPLTDTEIRRVMANCTRGEAARMAVPPWVRDVDHAEIDVVGWRDPKAPERGYLLFPRDGELVGIALRASTEGGVRASAMCALCRTTHSPGHVGLFVARRGGPAGRKGDTVGTYACGDLACARYVRVEKATAALRPDPGLGVDERRAGLRARVAAFAGTVLDPVD